MKIAMIGLKGIPATYGGIERHVEELSARLAAAGHDVTVYCRRHYVGPPPPVANVGQAPSPAAVHVGPPPSVAIYPNVGQAPPPAAVNAGPPFSRHPSGGPPAAMSNETTHRGVHLRILPSLHTTHLDTFSHTLLAALDATRRQYDILHFHAIGPAAFSFLPRLRLSGRPAVVATVHALDWRRRKWGPFARWFLRRGEWAATRFPHRTIVVSRAMESYFRARGRAVEYIPNGVPPPETAGLEALAPFGIAAPGFILWMGRFVPEKRVEDLVSAFRQLPGDHRLVLAVEVSESDPYFRSVRAAAGGDARILFPGGLYGPAKSAALSHAGLVALPSELEGFPIVLLEAMRHGRPVLASDIPENLEAVSPGSNGFTFPAGDVPALRDRFEWLLSHPSEAASAGAQAALDALRFDWDIITRQTEAVYSQARADLSRRR